MGACAAGREATVRSKLRTYAPTILWRFARWQRRLARFARHHAQHPHLHPPDFRGGDRRVRSDARASRGSQQVHCHARACGGADFLRNRHWSFPESAAIPVHAKLASTSARSEQSVAGWPYPQADEAFAAAGAYNKRLAESGQPVIGEAEDPLAELYNNNQSDSSDGSGSSSTGAGATGDGNKDSASSKDAEYQRLLDTGDGVMGSIRIPKISVDLPIYHGTSEQTLASGAGHLYGSSLPVGGKDTHAVITGHRGLVEASMFTRLDEMRVGDYFYIDVMGHTLGYMVDRITEIEPNDTSQLKITSGEDRVTLMTCTPYGVNTHRLLVSALRSAIPEEIPAEDDAAKDVRVIAGVVSAATLLVGLLLVWLLRCPWYVRRHAAWWPKRN